MKRLFWAISLSTVLLLTACGKTNDNKDNTEIEANQTTQQEANVNTEVQDNKTESIQSKLSNHGTWRVTKAFLASTNEEVGLNMLYGSGIHESNSLIFNEDGTFQKQIGVYAENYEGKYTIDEENQTIEFVFETSATTSGSYEMSEGEITSVSLIENLGEEYRVLLEK